MSGGRTWPRVSAPTVSSVGRKAPAATGTILRTSSPARTNHSVRAEEVTGEVAFCVLNQGLHAGPRGSYSRTLSCAGSQSGCLLDVHSPVGGERHTVGSAGLLHGN